MSKVIQRKMFRLTRTIEGFDIIRITRKFYSQKPTDKEVKSLEQAMTDNLDMAIGEILTVFLNKYDDNTPMIGKTYIKLEKGQIDPSLQ